MIVLKVQLKNIVVHLFVNVIRLWHEHRLKLYHLNLVFSL
jgi:hypothetical protein